MPPAEMVFHNHWGDRPRIVDFKAKWEESSFEYENTVREFPGDRLDATLAREMDGIVHKCWQLFGLRGYAIVDMRIDKLNRPYVNEVNANPCLFPESGLVAAVAEAGPAF
jgi:D-alanine-D-alanine ligase